MRKILLPACLLLSLSGCSLFNGDTSQAPIPPRQGGVETLDQLTKLQVHPKQYKIGINNIRRKGLEDTAMGVGARSGLASRAKEINLTLERDSDDLDNVFNFHALVMKNDVLPPVLTEGRTILNQPADDSIRISDVAYRIEKQARFVTAPPNWREYLWMAYNNPEVPNHTLLPQNAEEKTIWTAAVTQGWHEGIQQAEAIFQENLARLRRDYKGMILYRTLLAQHMVTPPYVAKTELGVTGDSNEMHINDKVLKITALPGLTTDPSEWRPVLSAKDYNGEEAVESVLDEDLQKSTRKGKL